MRRRLAASVLLVLCAGGGAASPGQRVAVETTTVGEQYLFAAANAERAQRGIPELRWDAALYRAADLHAREMAARASISHQYPGEPELTARARQAGARFSVIAENVAEAPTAVRIHDAWMASQGHRDNLLDPRVDSVGIRVVRRSGQLYAVEDFSRAVESLSLAEQEARVRVALMGSAAWTVLAATDDARRTCAMDTGHAGLRQPSFLMRYTTADVTKLPDALRTEMKRGRYRTAEVGACPANEDDGFSSYRLAVLLYP